MAKTKPLPPPDYERGNVRLYCADCLEILPQLPDGSVDAVVTDPPYAKEFDHVWDALGEPCYRVAAANAWLVTLLGHYQLPRVLDAVRAGRWSWWWSCTVRNKNQPIMHGYKAKCCHKPAMIFRKGNGMPRRIFFDDFALRLHTHQWRAAQSAHKWGQAEGIFVEPIEALSDIGGIILDPFMGAASVGVACIKLERAFIGIEIEPKYFERACQRIDKAFDDFGLIAPTPPAIKRQSKL